MENAQARKPRGIALVLGATGTIGGAVAKALLDDGWTVTALTRDSTRAQRQPGYGAICWIAGDAMNAADVRAAAQGAKVIFHGVNPPGYRNWRGLALPMMRNSIEAARSSGARLILLGTVYNYGPDAWPIVTEASPQNPRTRKGKIRVEMERLMRDAATQDVRSLIVRAGDFFGPKAKNSWLTQGILTPAKPLGMVRYPGDGKIGHAWAYVPDLAHTVARLAAIEADLPAFEMLNFRGHWLEQGIEIAQAVRRALGKSDLPIRPFPWPLVYVAAPFVTFMREMIEMRYLWRVPLQLDNSRLVKLLGAEPHTPLDLAVRYTLQGLGYISADAVDDEPDSNGDRGSTVLPLRAR
jgi:nucleoside-diphosphate-sugar epimerase